MRRGRIVLVSLFSLLFSATTLVALAEEMRPSYKEGEIIVKYKDGSLRTMEAMDTLYKRAKVLGVKRFHGVLGNFEHLTVDTSAQSVQAAAADLARDPNVEYVQPNYLIFAQDAREETPREESTPCYIRGIPYPPGCGNTGSPVASIPGRGGRPGIQPRPSDAPFAADPELYKTWGISKIGAASAWNRTRGSRNVIVAVIDTGIDYNHPDLAANVYRNPNYGRSQQTGIDDMASLGISNDLIGWDFVHNDNLPYDDAGHGTHVSGTIGAVGGNGRGVSGVNQRVSILAVKFLGANGVGDTASAIRGIDYAISRGAKVLNNSWGGRGGYNTALLDAIQRTANAGALFVASAGNDGTNNDTYFSFPASFEAPNMISVAATTSSDLLASFSNTGARTVHLGAPGQSIYSTLPGGRYGYMSGTSMAAPHVSGAAALVWAAHPSWSAGQVKQKLLSSGDYLPSLSGKTVTGRRLNVLRAVN